MSEDKNTDDTAYENQCIGNILCVLHTDQHGKSLYRITIHIPDIKRENKRCYKEKADQKNRNAELRKGKPAIDQCPDQAYIKTFSKGIFRI